MQQQLADKDGAQVAEPIRRERGPVSPSPVLQCCFPHCPCGGSTNQSAAGKGTCLDVLRVEWCDAPGGWTKNLGLAQGSWLVWTVPANIGGSPIVAAEAKDDAASALGADGLAVMLATAATAAAVGGGVAAGELDAKVDLLDGEARRVDGGRQAWRSNLHQLDKRRRIGSDRPDGLDEKGKGRKTDRRFLLGCSSEPAALAGESAVFLTVCCSMDVMVGQAISAAPGGDLGGKAQGERTHLHRPRALQDLWNRTRLALEHILRQVDATMQGTALGFSASREKIKSMAKRGLTCGCDGQRCPSSPPRMSQSS